MRRSRSRRYSSITPIAFDSEFHCLDCKWCNYVFFFCFFVCFDVLCAINRIQIRRVIPIISTQSQLAYRLSTITPKPCECTVCEVVQVYLRSQILFCLLLWFGTGRLYTRSQRYLFHFYLVCVCVCVILIVRVYTRARCSRCTVLLLLSHEQRL